MPPIHSRRLIDSREQKLALARQRKRWDLLFGLLIVFFLQGCDHRSPSPPEKPEAASVPKVIVEREKVDRESPLPPEVKIRLKRDGKDNYSWELSGSDADQVLKVNERLKKKLGGEQTK